jgi:HSP20 family protein
MANLMRRDNSRQDLSTSRRHFDEFFNRFLGWPANQQEEQLFGMEFSPAVESFIDTNNKKFHCEVLLAGVDPKDVNIQVHGNMLTISGERSNTREAQKADFMHQEITYGSFTRTIVLPEGVDKEKISAEYRNGTLEITAPIAASSLPRRIEIKSVPLSRAASG